MIDVNQVKNIIHKTPARQNQVCFRADIRSKPWGVSVNLYPTLELYDQGRTVYSDASGVYKSMVFHTGMAVGCLEDWAQAQGYRFEYLADVSDLVRNKDHMGHWLMEQLEPMLGHVVAWVEQQRLTNDLFKNYYYEVGKCHRDMTLLFESMYNDLALEITSSTAGIGNMFWDKNGQPVSRRPQEVAIHRELRGWMANKLASYNPRQSQPLLELYDLFISILDTGARPDLSQAQDFDNDVIRINIYE